MNDLSIETLHQLLICDAENGRLYWRARPSSMLPEVKDGREKNAAKWNSRFAGKAAINSGSGSHGYLDGAILGKGVLAHRVIWAMTHGRWPVGVDHINGDRRDNRIANLREADQAENVKNLRIRSDNKTGVAGVTKLRNGWSARIKSGNVQTYLGRFATLEDAIAAREAAQRRLGFHPNHGRAA